MKVESSIQSALPANFVSANEGTEGGLDVGQFLASLRRKAVLILGVAAAVTAAAAVKAFTDTPTYVGQFEVLVQPMSAETSVVSSVPGTLTSEETATNTSQVVVSADLIKILTSPRVLQPAVEKLQKQYPDITYDGIVRNLSISPLGKDSNILQIGYRNPDPQRVQIVLDTISKEYLDYSLQSRQADVQLALKFVEDNLPELEQQVDALQEQLQQLRQRNALIDPASRGQELSDQVNTFTQQQLDAQVELEQVQRLEADLRAQLTRQPNEGAASSALSQNPRYQSLLTQLQTVDAQIADASTIYTEEDRRMQLLREQRQNLLTLLAQEGQQTQREVISQMRVLAARRQALTRTIGGLNANINQLSGVSREYTDIQRDLEIKTANLSQFLAKREALQIDLAQRQVPWELLTPPTEPLPTATSLTNNLVLGAILGLLLGVGIALLLDRLTDVIYTSEELKRITRLPLLGMIPVNEEFNQVNSEAHEAEELEEVGVSASMLR
ncbi:MAG: capsular biosynthesis protein, partial [Microcoleus sp. SIO2G3]|nr:capsular biosynthesis protein [Microcoleus sp. SIO2G3]